jgi:hypothetical protein
MQHGCNGNSYHNMEDSLHLTRWSDNMEEDRGWGAQAFDGAERITPEKNKILRNKLVAPGLLCVSDGNIYVFLTTLNVWSIICAKQSIVFINNLIGIESATVRYGEAFEPYASFLEREASDRIAQDIPQSVCIGTERLKVAVVQGGLRLTRCESLLSWLPPNKVILSTLCYMPLSIRGWPSEWKRTVEYPMYRYLAPLFTDPVELKTLEWCIGHSMIDPHSFSKAVILYGRGGTGKTTTINAISMSMMGCCGTIPDSALINLSAGIPEKVAQIVASNRIVTAGDVGGQDRNTNLTVIKTLTGHDYMPLGPMRVKTACTLLYATNTLDDPRENAEWCTDAIMRRVVVIYMDAVVPEESLIGLPKDPISKLDFCLRCIHTRLTNPYMPVSPISVLMTLMGSRFKSVSKLLVPVTDDQTTEEDIITANIIVGAAIDKTPEEVGRLARRITPSAVVQIEGEYYVRGIEPSTHYG